MGYYDHFIDKTTKTGDKLTLKSKRREFSIISGFLKDKNSRILEIGPGKGLLAKIFMTNGYTNYDVVEPNDRMREELKRMGVKRAESYLVPPLKEQDNSYDAVVLINTFEHLSGSEAASLMVKEANRVLKPNGILAIASPDYLVWGKDFFNCDYTHANITTLRRCTQLFGDNGFQTVKLGYLYAVGSGCMGAFLGFLVRALTVFSKGNHGRSKFYKLKLTFSRRIIAIGQKTGS